MASRKSSSDVEMGDTNSNSQSQFESPQLIRNPTCQFGYQLPLEIEELLNEHICGGRPDKPHYFGSVPPQVCRVNRIWNQIFTDRLYAQFDFHGNINNMWSLWKFLFTIRGNPHLAEKVRELTLTTRQIYEPFNPEDIKKLFLLIWDHGPTHFREVLAGEQMPGTRDELAERLVSQYRNEFGDIKTEHKANLKTWLSYAIYRLYKHETNDVFREVGWDASGVYGPSGPNDSLRGWALRKFHDGKYAEGHQCPLTALVIAFCPNLVRLSFDVWIPGQDPWFERILGIATGRKDVPEKLQGREPMKYLETLNLNGKMVVGGHPWQRRRAPAGINMYRNYYELPSLKYLTIFNALLDSAIGSERASQIECFTMHGSYGQEELRALVNPALMPNLRQLSLDLSHGTGPWGQLSPDGPQLYAWLWPLLLPFKDQLEYLDLYQGPFRFLPVDTPFFDTQDLEPFCPPLSQFSKLRQLNLTLPILVGHLCQHDTTQKFRNHLPPRLESLGIYNDGTNWMPRYIENIEEELEGIAIVGSGAEGGRLRSIVCDDSHVGAIPTRKLETLATRRGILYLNKGAEYLFYRGGRSVWGDLNTTTTATQALWLYEHRDPARVIPRGMEVYDYKGRLRS